MKVREKQFAQAMGGARSAPSVLLLLLLVPFAVNVAACPLAADTTERVSVASDGTEGDGASEEAVITPDGRYVAFKTIAKNLVPGIDNLHNDVMVRDLLTGQVDCVSVSSGGAEGDSFLGYGRPSITPDGRYVAFSSNAGNLVPDDTNYTLDVFVRDRQAGTTERVSVASDGTECAGTSYQPFISADGRYVAFYSGGKNLVTDDTNGERDIFVHDRQSGTTERVSVSSAGEEANGYSISQGISADGRYVAFYSSATNLVPGDTNNVRDIFVHDRTTGVTERVSVASDGTEGDDWSDDAAMTSDGRFVAYRSGATNLVAGDTNGYWDVFVRDRQAGTTERVSVASDGAEANESSYTVSISPDGRYVSFGSRATNLVTDDTNEIADLFLHDRETGTTERVSVRSDGGEPDDESYQGFISTGGRFVVFTSEATNLVPGDTNEQDDIFLRDRLRADFTASPTSGTPPLNVEFTGYANYTPATWEWEFGDGSTSAAQNPTHVYEQPGTYTVSLTVSDTRGSDGEVKTAYIVVRFSDVPADNWACDEVLACVDAEIVAGYPDGLYHPDIAVTRDQMAAYTARALAGGDDNVPEFTGTPSFSDVDAEHWALDYVEYAAEQNVVQGYDDGTYHPDEEVTRAQMAVYVARAMVAPDGEAGLAGYAPADPRYFPDALPDFWAWKHIEYCVEHGVVQGYLDGYYHPEDVVTRDQMAVYIARAFELVT